MFDDLCYHLQANGFDIFDKWGNYKTGVSQLEISELILLDSIEQIVSGIFIGLPLRFDKYSRSLSKDFGCNIPQLFLDDILGQYTNDLYLSRYLKEASDDEEAAEIYRDFSHVSLINYLDKLPLIEEGNSLVWGYPDYIADYYQLIRIPKKGKDIFIRCKDQAISFFIFPPQDIKNGISKMTERLKQLEQERAYMLKELQSTLYCQSFSGDCKYLGGKSS